MLWPTAIVVCVLALLLAAAWSLQGRLIFPRDYANQRARPGPPAGVEALWTTAPDGVRVEAWLVRGDGVAVGRPAPLVIFFHGNGELIDDQLALAATYAGWGASVLLPEYRGYGRSQGEPSQDAIVADMVRLYDSLAARDDTDVTRVVYHGRSLGGGVAAALAAERPPAALVLESTFTSLAALARTRGLPEWLCRHPFRTDRVLPQLGRPVLVLHGSDDALIPPAHGRELAARAPGSTYVELAGEHNDFPRDRAAYEAALLEFLRSHGVLTR